MGYFTKKKIIFLKILPIKNYIKKEKQKFLLLLLLCNDQLVMAM